MTKRQREWYKNRVVEYLVDGYGVEENCALEQALKLDELLIKDPMYMDHIGPRNMAHEIWESMNE